MRMASVTTFGSFVRLELSAVLVPLICISIGVAMETIEEPWSEHDYPSLPIMDFTHPTFEERTEDA